MKKIFLSLILLFCTFMAVGQTNLCSNIYYFKNPEHTIKTYYNILVFTNAGYSTKKVMPRVARRAKYKITMSDELFPPVKDYTDAEIARAIRANHIDAILYLTLKGTKSTSSYTYGTYQKPVIGNMGHFESHTVSSNYRTAIEAVLVEPGTKEIKEFYCSGDIKGKQHPATLKVMHTMLRRFQKIGISEPLPKEILEEQEEQPAFYPETSAAENFPIDSTNAQINTDIKSQQRSENASVTDYISRAAANYKLKNYVEALQDLNKVIQIDSRNVEAYDIRQQVKFAISDFAGCIEDCDVAISLNPKLAGSYLFRGKAFLQKGDKIKACENWSKAGEFGAMEGYELIKVNCY